MVRMWGKDGVFEEEEEEEEVKGEINIIIMRLNREKK
jgi:hypothetical protein